MLLYAGTSVAADAPAHEPGENRPAASSGSAATTQATAGQPENATPAPAASPAGEQPQAGDRPRIIIVPSTRRPAPPPAPEPPRDPTLISVPSNTLGPGEPLWVRSDRQAAEARAAEAVAAIVEREARSPRYDNERYDPVVIYGPRGATVLRGGFIGPHRYRFYRGTGLEPGSTTTTVTSDPIDRAQIRFGETARPRIGPAIEANAEAQRRFGETARPRISESQRQRDDAQIRLRKQSTTPE